MEDFSNLPFSEESPFLIGSLYEIVKANPYVPENGIMLYDNLSIYYPPSGKAPFGSFLIVLESYKWQSDWFKVLYTHKIHWINLNPDIFTLRQVKERNQLIVDCPLSLLTRASGDIV